MREITRAQKARLGIFLLVSGGILLIMLIVVTGARLFEKRDFYDVRYKDVSVSGVEIGAQVKYHGVRVGRVEEIYIDPEQIETVVVRLSLDHGTPVKTDVKAVITALSLTGIKLIELTGGSSEAELIEPGSEIPAGESSIQAITGKAEAVSEKLELVLSNLAVITGSENQKRLFEMIDNTANVLADVHGILSDNRGAVANTVQNLEAASIAINNLASSDELLRALASIDTTATSIQKAKLGEAIGKLYETLNQAQTTLSHFDVTLLEGRHDLLTSLEIMRESLDSFNEFARLISEDPSLLLRGTRVEEVGGLKGK
ncbi:MAG TPA: MCE family protein [Bacteroidetes bacterium]|nr:MCE family protein [Bacteroidota bacterium]